MTDMTPERAAGDLIARLEEWIHGRKDRAMQMSIDNSFGATCWTVELFGNSKHLVVSEVNFLEPAEKDCGPMQGMFHDSRPAYPYQYLSYVVLSDDMDDWPGLRSTLDRALQRAQEIGM